jgi:hypothetical protein
MLWDLCIMLLNRKFVVSSCSAMLGLSVLVALPLISDACTTPKIEKPGALPNTLKPKILADLRNRLGLPQSAAGALKIVKVAAVADRPEPAVSNFPGWRVTVQAEGQDWVYIARQNNLIQFDAVASVPAKVRQAVAQKMQIPPQDLQLKAAELVTNRRQCPINSGCPIGYDLKWRILPNSLYAQPYNFDAKGSEWQRWPDAATSSAGLPPQVKTAVMRDVVNRARVIPPNLAVETIKAVTWNDCRGGSDSSPTPIPRGICADINRSGWQMRVRSGPIRYTYYVQSNSTDGVGPDGMQSVPIGILEQVKRDVSQRTKVAAPEISVIKVSAQYFDRCLNGPGTDCQTGIITGWSVTTTENQPKGPTTFSEYHVSLNGEQIRFVQAGTYHYPASAPPPVMPRSWDGKRIRVAA